MKRNERAVEKAVIFFRENPDRFFTMSELEKKLKCTYVGSMIFRIRESLLYGEIVTVRGKGYKYIDG